VKKKSPPYAIIGAAVLGILAIFIFVKWKQSQDSATAAAVAKAQADMQAQIDALKSQQAPTVVSTPTNMRNVLYATSPVEAGQKISSTFYESKLTPTDILPDAYTDKSDVVGFYAIRNIEKGDPLTPRNIGKSLPYLTQRISPGMRAVALPIFNADANNTGGFVVDGDKVDLLFTTTNKGFLIKTEMVMQNVPVLYVPGPKIESDQMNGVTPAPPPGGSISITFEVTPEQAQALVFMAQAKPDQGGKFSMILRSRRDKEEIKIKPFDGNDYYGNLQKIQKTTDKSEQRVQELAAKIEAEEKNQQGSPGNTTNETPTPTPPSP
jgi:Flp pilus assembly protein CpaB